MTQDPFIEERGGGYEKHNKEMRGVLRGSTEDDKFMLVDTGLRIQGRRGYLSRFPQNVGRVLIEVHCPANGTIYDPFAGHNSRMQLAFRCERNYIGVDVCSEYMKINRDLRQKLLDRPRWPDDPEPPTIQLIEGSSAKVDLPDNHADFTITSPPYWDLEYYGPEAEQLGNNEDYEDFLEALYPHIVENERILKPGAFCIWCINDFRKNKEFHAYHIDLYKRFVDAGFEPFNIYIIDLVSVVQASFTRDIIEHKIVPKQHEYVLVFRKRETVENGD
jgi:DNA modification methylase